MPGIASDLPAPAGRAVRPSLPDPLDLEGRAVLDVLRSQCAIARGLAATPNQLESPTPQPGDGVSARPSATDQSVQRTVYSLIDDLADLAALATQVLNDHTDDHGLCQVCRSAFPCELVVLADHNLAVCG